MKKSVTVTAVWLRSDGDRLKVLLEIDGEWRVAIEDRWPVEEALVSHCAHASGKDKWPADE